MKLSRTVMYALQALCQLGDSPEPEMPVPSKKLANQGQMPDRFLLQILRNLVSHGILKSTRGVIGGYTLARPAEKISLLNVIEAVEGPIKLEIESAAVAPPKLQEALGQVTDDVRRELDRLKLAQLLSVGAEAASNSR